jgi:hypothetical protein
MIPFISLLGSINWTGLISKFFGWLWTNKRAGVEILMGAWIVFCILTHNGSWTRNGPCEVKTGDTLGITHDTTYIYPDTNLILHLNGFDTIPETVTAQTEPRWSAPELVIPHSASTSDSLSEILVALDFLETELYDCDSTYRWDTAERTYKDTTSNEDIDVFIDIKVKGALIDTPKVSYVWKRPEMQVNTVVDIAVVPDPKRKIGVGVETGPAFDVPTKFNSLELDLNLEYIDRKNNGFVLEAGYRTDNSWIVKFGYKKYFDF